MTPPGVIKWGESFQPVTPAYTFNGMQRVSTNCAADLPHD